MRKIPHRLTAAALAAITAATALSGCVVAPAAPPYAELSPGQPLPPDYRDDRYRVDDWRARGLYEPPPGYGWRYVDGQYVLVAVATGIIAAAFLGALFGPGGHGPFFGPR
ncbi:MAG: RcnB family protein [Comamonas sp.]